MGQVGVPTVVGELAGPLPGVSPLISCADLDQIFRLRSDLSSVAVQEAGGRVGLVMRDPFIHLMSGPYGYGRALWEKPESAELSVLTGAVPQLAAIRRHGVAIMLDDMGAGLSTLRHLSVLPVTGIKIDQLFVGGMLDNRNDHAVVRLLSDLGHNLGLAVTAEGVETAEHLAELRRLGVPHAQGYYTGRPQPPDRLLDSMQAALVPAPAPWLAATA